MQQASGEEPSGLTSMVDNRSNIGYQQEANDYNDNNDLIEKVLDLEKDQAEKIQENRLLMLRYKNIQSSGSENRSLHSLPASRDS